VLFGGGGPARAMVIAARVLRAAVKHDNQGGSSGQALRDVGPSVQAPRIGTESLEWHQGAVFGPGQAYRSLSKRREAAYGVLKAAHEFS
jgi:hypothetical protein